MARKDKLDPLEKVVVLHEIDVVDDIDGVEGELQIEAPLLSSIESTPIKKQKP